MFHDSLGDFFGGLGDLAGQILPGLIGGSSTPGPQMGPMIPQRGPMIPSPMGQVGQVMPASFGGPLVRQIPGMIGGGILSEILPFDPSGGLRAPFGSSFCVEPELNAAGQLRWPKQVMFQTGPGKVETYVRAPKVRFRVTGTVRRRRRCSGGY